MASIRGFSPRFWIEENCIANFRSKAKWDGYNYKFRNLNSKEVRRLMFTRIYLVLAGKVARKRKETNFLVSHGDP